MPATISFDLDDTLIGCNGAMEPIGILGRLMRGERLRLGTRILFKELRKQGYQLAIYTTSLRPHGRIRNTFSLHGLWLNQIVNGEDHQEKIMGGSASKRPDLYGFQIHIDDAPIGESGETKVIVVDKSDQAWDHFVLDQLQKLNQNME